MQRRRKLRILAGVIALLMLVGAIIYVAFPRVLLRAAVAAQRSAAGFECDWVQVADWQLPYLDSQPAGPADREIILLVHGFGDRKDSWLELASGLTADYRVVALDLPGFGETHLRRDETYSAAFYVDVMSKFLDQLEIDAVHLVGYSMGGMLAAKFASDWPRRVQTLTLLAPAGLPGEQSSELDRIMANGKGNPLIYRDRESFERLMRLNFGQPLDLPDFVIRAVIAEGRERADLHEAIFEELFNPADIADFAHEVAKLQVPTVVIWGQQDQILDVSATAHWARVKPDARIIKLPGVGHDLIHQRKNEIRKQLRAQIKANPTPADLSRLTHN